MPNENNPIEQNSRFQSQSFVFFMQKFVLLSIWGDAYSQNSQRCVHFKQWFQNVMEKHLHQYVLKMYFSGATSSWTRRVIGWMNLCQGLSSERADVCRNMKSWSVSGVQMYSDCWQLENGWGFLAARILNVFYYWTISRPCGWGCEE